MNIRPQDHIRYMSSKWLSRCVTWSEGLVPSNYLDSNGQESGCLYFVSSDFSILGWFYSPDHWLIHPTLIERDPTSHHHVQGILHFLQQLFWLAGLSSLKPSLLIILAASEGSVMCLPVKHCLLPFPIPITTKSRSSSPVEERACVH